MTPIQHAAYKGDLPLVNYLIKLGAKVNGLRHSSGYSTLQFAALSGWLVECVDR